MNVKNIKLFLHVGIGENMFIFLYIKSQRSLFYVHHDNECLLHNVEDSSGVFKGLLCTFAGSFKFTIGFSRASDALVALDPMEAITDRDTLSRWSLGRLCVNGW